MPLALSLMDPSFFEGSGAKPVDTHQHWHENWERAMALALLCDGMIILGILVLQEERLKSVDKSY